LNEVGTEEDEHFFFGSNAAADWASIAKPSLAAYGIIAVARHPLRRPTEARSELGFAALLRPGTFWSHGGAFAMALITLTDC
jgi:hypothetical protein